ncbi:hypothetical protein [Microbulbifer thermotolerans]|nr:hypothetical protein [Microbulbifer thermotolerans]MCX2780703.1 hypothetical protein [Microbulbifer thermotolerans]MCX2783571.1 hypothetical protein [Microbulbifer thermotolerans]MCX2795782.1 hypothetical protein [Microbulbifer thermotolerans]MCX2801946.1 hypothetical protein [Microbulbifer thermotolerans]MCX2806309.1 hypothetical protein [Microbulbifer thermotolerans]
MPAEDILGTFSLPQIYIFSVLLVLVLLAVGRFFGRRAARRDKSVESSLGSAVALALAFSLVILLIVDLDRSYEGFLIVDQTPMVELSRRFETERGSAN